MRAPPRGGRALSAFRAAEAVWGAPWLRYGGGLRDRLNIHNQELINLTKKPVPKASTARAVFKETGVRR